MTRRRRRAAPATVPVFARSVRLAVFLSPGTLRWLEDRRAAELKGGGSVRSVGAMASAILENAAARARAGK